MCASCCAIRAEPGRGSWNSSIISSIDQIGVVAAVVGDDLTAAVRVEDRGGGRRLDVRRAADHGGAAGGQHLAGAVRERHRRASTCLSLVPGIGVGRGADGRLWHFMSLNGRYGSMAERAVIDTRRSVVLPAHADPVTMAAPLNCVIASWLALTQRITLRPGQNILVLGATGGTGSMAVAVARRLAAGQVAAVGRDPGRGCRDCRRRLLDGARPRPDARRRARVVAPGRQQPTHRPRPALTRTRIACEVGAPCRGTLSPGRATMGYGL